MKNIDFKSIIIGSLLMLCFFLFIGQRSDENLGDITVNTITIKDDGDGGHIRIFNPQGNETTYIGNHKENGGFAMFSNKDGNLTTIIGSDLEENTENQYGVLHMFNASGERMTYLGTGTANNGVLLTFNQEGNETAYLGTGADGWGGLVLSDDQDNIYFFENGDSKLRKRPY